MSGPLILIPAPIPQGPRVMQGDATTYPSCDRCHREGSDRNPVWLTKRRSWSAETFADIRYDAICHDCRLALKGRI